MADPNEAESVQIGAEVAAKTETDEVKKKAPRPKKAKAQPKRAAAKEAAKPMASASPVLAKKARKVYSEQERTQKLGQIEKSIRGGESVKSATRQAGISEQTYYQWKKTATPASESGDLKDLIALEEENKRLKGLLAERLRKENAELKKKLGLG